MQEKIFFQNVVDTSCRYGIIRADGGATNENFTCDYRYLVSLFLLGFDLDDGDTIICRLNAVRVRVPFVR